ncbi:hypothetical protein DCS_05371 [Drechmeria coniospora]|uniref:Uncharacterized protein n=1 Tax=Drechmeria coniospora TaxID=98403 RepID=A0A151GMQ7_DRECN|nr:hypothetical protein DCS_05371 [Drechmeria coniospora]KYK58358.1 hypothetical protein DCS_05371 [Drechmeria coniospora]ODA83726.1 hypothetical protein RJ55_02241 [Drechmeria coniospora]
MAANLPSEHPALSVHLADVALTPLITSSSSPVQLDALTSLTSGALVSQTAARRTNLGRPQRIMVEYPDAGAVVLQSYLDPPHGHPHRREAAPPTTFASASASASERHDEAAPMLVCLVVAPSSRDAREARRAAAKLESIGRQFQHQWGTQGAARNADRGPDSVDFPAKAET